MSIRRTTLAVSLLASASALATSAFAQTAPAAEPEALEEVIVTAQRVATSAQTTPISMSVYTPSDLQAAGVHDIGSLVAVDPSVKLTASNGTGYVAVRGIASTDLTEIGDPAVPVARDGFFTNRSYTLFGSLYDIGRVEVLKGPQGTLFGRNSTGGLVNIISQRPQTSYGGYASAEIGNYRAANFEGAVNIPLYERAQLRVSGLSRYQGGYRDNIIQNGDDEQARSFRTQLALEPVDGLTALLSYQYDRLGGTGGVEAKGAYESPYAIEDEKTFLVPTRIINDLREHRYRWEAAYNRLPLGVTLTYLGGYDTTSFVHNLDATPLTGPLQQFVQGESPHTTNHEVRLSSASNGQLTWQVGYFYYNDNNVLDSGLQQQSGVFDGRYLIHFNYRVHTRSEAFFGQASYKLNDELKLTVGARTTKDQKERSGQARLDLAVATGGFLNGVVTTPGDGATQTEKPTYHLGLDWTPTSRNLVYAKFDTGYKSGGFNSNGASASVPYGPETVKAYELGSKNRFLENRLQLNVALFYQKYSGYQASQFTPALGGGPGVQNAGSARIYGAEGELVALVDNVGQISLNATLLNARFTEFLAVSADGASQVNLKGNDLPNAPDATLTAAFEHEWRLPAGVLTGRIDGKYQSKSYFSFFNFEDVAQPSYTTGNVSLTFEPAGGRWSLQGYVRNFTDEVVLANATRNSNVLANTYSFAAPRTVGVKLNVNW